MLDDDKVKLALIRAQEKEADAVVLERQAKTLRLSAAGIRRVWGLPKCDEAHTPHGK